MTGTDAGITGPAAESSNDRPLLSLLVYVALTYVLAWTLWLAAASVGVAPDRTALRQLLFLPGTFMPGLVAIALVAWRGGATEVRRLLRPLVTWRVGVRWYAFALGYMIAIKLLVAVVHRAIVGSWPPFGSVPVYLMIAAVLVSTPFQAGEEVGWRGYLLPRLTARIGLAGASLVLGVVWAAWHLPLFVIDGTSTSGQPFTPYLLSVTALSVAMAWLWARTRGSLLLVMMMHAAVNNTKDIVPSSVPGVSGPSTVSLITTALLWIGAAWFLLLMRRKSTRDT